MEASNNWATFSMKETMYWHDGMTPEEYEEERTYYYKNMDKVQNGTYEPLWKQGKQSI